MIATSPADILRFVLARADEGVATALVTLTGIERTSSRSVGTQMAVAADGRYAGSFSGGCVEAAVVSEALEVIAAGEARLVRFGIDSKYIDIKLPCGGGVDLLFNPRPDRDSVADVLARLERRGPAALRVSHGGVKATDADPKSGSAWDGDCFDVQYVPEPRIVAIGQGEDLTALARLAHRYGADVTALSPEAPALELLAREGIDTIEIVSRNTLPAVASDPWTAIIFLFHDRDWEEGLLPQALKLPAFYFGAVGSRRTQQLRIDLLRDAHVPDDEIESLRGPVGLIPATRNPSTLAVSILAEIVGEYQRVT